MKISSILTAAMAAAVLLTSPVLAKRNMPSCKGATVYAVPAEKVYYEKGATQYGHVKGGTYMCEATAHSKGYKKASTSTM
jgi:hypothetical protein